MKKKNSTPKASSDDTISFAEIEEIFRSESAKLGGPSLLVSFDRESNDDTIEVTFIKGSKGGDPQLKRSPDPAQEPGQVNGSGNGSEE